MISSLLTSQLTSQWYWKEDNTKARYCINYDTYGWKDDMDGWTSGYGEQAMARNPSLGPKNMRMNECGEISNSFRQLLIPLDRTRRQISRNFWLTRLSIKFSCTIPAILGWWVGSILCWVPQEWWKSKALGASIFTIKVRDFVFGFFKEFWSPFQRAVLFAMIALNGTMWAKRHCISRIHGIAEYSICWGLNFCIYRASILMFTVLRNGRASILMFVVLRMAELSVC